MHKQVRCYKPTAVSIYTKKDTYTIQKNLNSNFGCKMFSLVTFQYQEFI